MDTRPQIIDNLAHLRNLVKRDADAYLDEFHQQVTLLYSTRPRRHSRFLLLHRLRVAHGAVCSASKFRS